ncbi:high affinity cAMP-specific and IBMX-insensitive 3',5'-cyclic phosphodiesterase 8B-like isoform X3 [Ptychodera flava]|uniref:high affinity cAMP-specific and IBMX-insensitive 3',5'-cyclic phosphodiesterase 8B-like isoform X3 n=1 Tax=Ptychodera flava TaxID=63121 RepID=UPI003969D54C
MMGCAPSIHVSQSGVVYCRDSDESNSPRPSSFSHQQQHTHLIRSTEITEPAPSSITTGQPQFNRRDRRGTISIEAETQTSRSTAEMKEASNELNFGPMKMKQPNMQILLVFAKEDAQSDGFWWAADKGGYKCNIVRNPTSALECFLEKRHDVIIIDRRHCKSFDADALCRSIRATRPSDHTVIIAVTRKSQADKEEPSILPLLNAGFNRRYTENTNTGACLNELIQLEHGEVRLQCKLRSSTATFTALDSVSDAVEISSSDHEIQYVNPAFERLTGYTSEEILGKSTDSLMKSDGNKQEILDMMYSQLRKGKIWEGTFYTRRKNGEALVQNVYVTPVTEYGGKVKHHIFVRRGTSYNQTVALSESGQLERYKDGIDLQNGVVLNRRQSMARIHSMTIEAPITKVINIINAAQENSPITVVQALDRVLEILRTTELYSPQLNPLQVKEEDQITSDYVGGLMSQGINPKRKFSGSDVTLSKVTHHHIPSTSPASQHRVPPHIEAILENSSLWDFNIVELEKATNKRPLMYLGMSIFQRFGVPEFLGVSEGVILNWLQLIEANYHSANPYHNSSHAADVLHATAFFLEKDRLKACLEISDEIAAIIAAVVHDVDHPGRTNSFLCNAGSDLAVLYNDVAVLESHHSALAFQLTTRDDRCNIFKELERDDYRQIRQTIIDMVLATEMVRHFEHLSKFVNSIKPAMKDIDDGSSMHSGGRGTPDSSSTSAALTTPENRMLIKRMLIKCADISNPARPLNLCIEWANRIAQEYCSQTDEEKRRGLPVVMPVFERNTLCVSKSQVSFIDYFVVDMFDAWETFADCSEVTTHLQNNYKYWKQEEEKDRRGKSEKK